MLIYLVLMLSMHPHFTYYIDAPKEQDFPRDFRPLPELAQPVPAFYDHILGCNEIVILSDPYIVPAYYQAINQIIAEGILLNGSTVFRAGQEIILAEGFEVTSGATLDLEIGPCTL